MYVLGRGSDAERAAFLGDTHAPAFLDVEVTHSLRGLLRGAKIDLEDASFALDQLGLLPARRHPDHSLLGRAWELRDVCTIYDGLYVACRAPLPLVT